MKRSSRAAFFSLESREARESLHEDSNVCADCYLLIVSSVPRTTTRFLCFTFVSLALFRLLSLQSITPFWGRENEATYLTWHYHQRGISLSELSQNTAWRRNKRIPRPPLPNCIGNLHSNRAESGAKYRSASIDISGPCICMRANIP